MERNGFTLYIRADGNERIGTGHIMRCLAIAEKIRALCQDVTFIVADSRSRPMIENRGFKTICLDSKWDDLDCETEKLVSVLQKDSADKLLIDSYFVMYLRRILMTCIVLHILSIC